MIKIGGGAGVVTHLKPPPPRGHSITKHTGGWLEGLNQKPQTIYPKIALLKKMPKKKYSPTAQRSAIWDKLSFSLRIVPLTIHMNHFSYP